MPWLFNSSARIPSFRVYFRNLSKGTQSPGERSYVQKVQPLQLGRLYAAVGLFQGFPSLKQPSPVKSIRGGGPAAPKASKKFGN